MLITTLSVILPHLIRNDLKKWWLWKREKYDVSFMFTIHVDSTGMFVHQFHFTIRHVYNNRSVANTNFQIIFFNENRLIFNISIIFICHYFWAGGFKRNSNTIASIMSNMYIVKQRQREKQLDSSWMEKAWASRLRTRGNIVSKSREKTSGEVSSLLLYPRYVFQMRIENRTNEN